MVQMRGGGGEGRRAMPGVREPGDASRPAAIRQRLVTVVTQGIWTQAMHLLREARALSLCWSSM